MVTESLIVELDVKIDKLNRKLDQVDKKMGGVSASTIKAENSLIKMGKSAAIAATAVAAAITTTTAAAVSFARELEVAAQRSNATVEEMQSLAFATNTVGVSLEKLGDIGKDANEKIGEFLATGGGGFVDFVDVMKLSAQEARNAAAEFQTMSGPAVLQEMVKRMEQAGVSGNKMSFALEGLSNNATDLIPLLRDNGREINRLKGEFEELGTTLSQEQIDNIKRVGEEFSKLGETFGGEGRQLIADYSEELIFAIETIKSLGVTSIDAFNVIGVGWGNLIELAKSGIDDLVNGTDTFGETLIERTKLTQDALNELLGENQKALEITVTKGDKTTKEEVKREKLSQSERLKNQQQFLRAGSILANTFFEDNKAIQAAFIVAETAAGISRQFADLPFPAALATSAVVAATGIAQLAALQSASPGGGSISAPGGGGSSASTPQETFTPETTSLELSAQDEFSTSTQRIILETSDGDTLVDFITNRQNENDRNGG